MNFGMIMLNQNMMKRQIFVTWIQTVSLFMEKIDYIYRHTAEDAKTRFDTSNFEIDRPLAKGKDKNLIGLMKNELGGQIIKKFVGLRARAYSIYLKDNNDEHKKEKGTKKCVIKRKVKFQDYKNCLEAAQIEIKVI